MLLIMIRAIFVLVVAGLGVQLARIGGDVAVHHHPALRGGDGPGGRPRGRRLRDPSQADPDDLGDLFRARSSGVILSDLIRNRARADHGRST